MWPSRQKQAANSSDDGIQGEAQRVLSILTPREVASLGGLPGEGVAGIMDGDVSSVEAFRPNQVFIDFMHQVIRTAGPKDSVLRAAAVQQKNGWVYIIDLRTPEGPMGNVPPEDIIGAFEVQSGQVIAESYWRNPEHRVFTKHGLVQLPPTLRKAFVLEKGEVTAG